MKRKTAKEILAESFKELAAIRDIENITIKEITDNCGYSPGTFYRQFKDKYDLIAWDYAKEVEQNIGKIGRDGHTWKQALLVSAKYNIKHMGRVFLHISADLQICQLLSRNRDLHRPCTKQVFLWIRIQ